MFQVLLNIPKCVTYNGLHFKPKTLGITYRPSISPQTFFSLYFWLLPAIKLKKNERELIPIFIVQHYWILYQARYCFQVLKFSVISSYPKDGTLKICATGTFAGT